ncbi:Non-reducing end beta-L-arabinofuranosidase [Pedobacter sp. Bi27]|uniref:glycoside hydrolase family 127 protein n=1 Tax=Pedobacter sp. Bi27 TaxID=2822351 RepID=UPI001D534056|nr:beta-L-arabinofuranosidase domain-containing protein [Pedobacter sp. Bi27]CAH0293471.1 Non-reducing end beta-L-arabinofuranosidase [Pedobacter sp. Bi27]
MLTFPKYDLLQKHFLCLGISVLFNIGFCGNVGAQKGFYANSFPLKQVKLLSGSFDHARDLNIKTLLAYDIDRLLYPYLKQAALPTDKKGYDNWEGLDGHIAGHYLSALALNYASTGNPECKSRMEKIVTTLKACQHKNTTSHPEWGIGYAGGVPNSKEIWMKLKEGNFKAYQSAWVPWYNVHKTFAGLRDAWIYGESKDAKEVFLKFCDWAIAITSKLNEQQMQQMLDTEHGGMNEVLADAFQITGNEKYLNAAMRFSHQQLLTPMAKGQDNLDNKHANTQVPKAVGFQRIGELSHQRNYDQAGQFFWETVTGKRSLAFGGNSRREFFPSAVASADFVDDVEGPETCNTYNMLKLTEGLFREKPDAKYVDFYEKALYNHILSSQHPEHGGYVYFTPARPRHYRVYSAPNEGMWCCVGSGMENHSKYNEFIYTHQKDTLYLNLFIASELNWKEKNISIRQETTFPDEEKTRLIVVDGNARFMLMIRKPSWVGKEMMEVKINGKKADYKLLPNAYLGIGRNWKKGDVVELSLPMKTTIERMPNLPEYVAIMHGPILLGAKTGTEALNGLVAGDSRWGHIASGKKLPINKAPILIDEHIDDIGKKIEPIKGQSMKFSFVNERIENPEKITLEPFYRIHDSRYMMYWMALTPGQYAAYLDSAARVENEKLALESRTVDFVAPGEQQPEVDHQMKNNNSHTGSYLDQFWRNATGNGFFSYEMNTEGADQLALNVRYHTSGGRDKFDIYLDDQKLVGVDAGQGPQKTGFYNQEYPIPAEMLKGKKRISVKFSPSDGKSTARVFYVRLVKK